MVERLGNNTQQRLIAGRQGAPRQNIRRANAPAGRRDNDDVIVNAGERRYLWTARAFAVVVAVSLCCNIVLMLAIGQLLPLYRLESFILTFENKQEQVYNIQPLSNMESRKEITETFVREYVLLRSAFSSNVKEMESRWLPGGPIQEMSTSAVYQAFIEKTAKKALDTIKKKGLVRSVRIMTVNDLGNGIWQVEYETRDMYPSSPAPKVEYWTVSLRVGYRKKNVKYGERLNNPIGFTVGRYNVSRNKPE